MMDERFLEKCIEQNEALRDAEIEKIRASVPSAGVLGPEICDCGTPIPERRREAGYQNCVACASVAERRKL